MKSCLFLLLTLAAGSCVAAESPILFSRGIMEDIGEADIPSPEEEISRIELVAVRGEFEPFSLAIRPRSSGDWRIVVSDLQLAGERRQIPSSAVEVALLHYGETRRYKVKDWILAPGATEVSLEKDKTARLWLTVHAPDEAVPGRYNGVFTLKGQGGADVRIPLSLDVLPVKIRPVPGVNFCALSTVSPYTQYFNPKKKTELQPKVVAFYRELIAHGMTCVSLKCSDWPYQPGKLNGLVAEVEAAGKAGFRGPIIWNVQALINAAKGGKRYAHYDGKCDNWTEASDLANLRDIVMAAKRMERDRGWPEVVFYTIDEPGTQTENWDIRARRMDIMVKSLNLVAKLDARGTTTVSELVDDRHNTTRWSRFPNELRQRWDRARPYCHIRIYAYGYPQGVTSLFAERTDARRRGHEVWFYNNLATMGQSRYCARLYFGLWGWKVKADGLTAWTYPGGRTVQWEIVREGIDDAKYLAIMKKLIDEKRCSEAARKETQAFLDDLKASIKLDENGFLTDWRLVDFSTLKHRMAELIRKLAR